MQREPSDFWLANLVLLLAIASIAVWISIYQKSKVGPILAYESRRPVPWGGIWMLLPLLYVALAVYGAIWGGEPGDVEPDSADLAQGIAFGSAQQVILVGALFVALVAASGATRFDLGLPKDRDELVRDVRIGAIAWLAALAPVYVVQIVLVLIFGEPEGHPLTRILQEHASPMLFALAFVAAVVVAPVCEEFAFRLLLQGWLEKWEDERLGSQVPMINDEARMTHDELQSNDRREVASEVSSFPPGRGLAGLPYGWMPILASSLLFAIAHFGYGPDPIPLFLLALILGYVYQRTHRILPSIVAHALFNGMSLFALWRITTTVAP